MENVLFLMIELLLIKILKKVNIVFVLPAVPRYLKSIFYLMIIKKEFHAPDVLIKHQKNKNKDFLKDKNK